MQSRALEVVGGGMPIAAASEDPFVLWWLMHGKRELGNWGTGELGLLGWSVTWRWLGGIIN